MTTTTATPPKEHTSVSLLMEKITKDIKRNPAMSVGELWQFHLKPLLAELHEYHTDYTDEAADEDIDPEYVDALVAYVVDAKELVLLFTESLIGSFEINKFLDEQKQPVAEKMPEDLRKTFAKLQEKLGAWQTRYAQMVDETPDDGDGEDNGAEEPQAQEGAQA